ncbi:hypothetical protein [Marixanthomonas spongiae]|uniref:Uncharacterized protein n=1 Tax=Marixanthomonas spongiae TaxID=2174845 RepID=A0A2U0I2K2_9FLAO|nr:hypothetical protein [Marixanthomonas spongiae]PVW15336.1 hypothetical protein DDV96_08030 [Marixanthomonas spongiae]
MKNLTIILSIFLFVSCSSDDDKNTNENTSSETDFNLVTGINIRNSVNGDGIQLGNPNIYTNNQFIAYPNPPVGQLNLESNQNISNVWITPANAEKIYQETDFNEILNSDLYSETQIDSNATLKLLNQSSSSIFVNLESLNSGYYKVFVEIDEKIYWDTIYIGDDNFEIEDLINYWE